MKHFSAVLLCLLFCCSVDYNSELDNTESLEAITQVRNNHVEAVNTINLDLLIRDMSPDIVYLAPGIKPIVGIDALKYFVAPIYEQISPEIEMIPSDIKVQDRLAVEWGIINGKISYKSTDSSSSFTNNYVFVYEINADGKWLITKDIYN